MLFEKTLDFMIFIYDRNKQKVHISKWFRKIDLEKLNDLENDSEKLKG